LVSFECIVADWLEGTNYICIHRIKFSLPHRVDGTARQEQTQARPHRLTGYKDPFRYCLSVVQCFVGCLGERCQQILGGDCGTVVPERIIHFFTYRNLYKILGCGVFLKTISSIRNRLVHHNPLNLLPKSADSVSDRGAQNFEPHPYCQIYLTKRFHLL
jgi:hypothetical protein